MSLLNNFSYLELSGQTKGAALNLTKRKDISIDDFE